MRNLSGIAVALPLAFLLLPVAVSAQAPTWRPGNRSMTSAQEKEAAAKAKTLPLKARDLSGVWGLGANGFNLDQRAVPPMTPEGKARYDAAKPGLGPRGVPLGNDPLMICDPVGYPRSFTYNYGMEFIETPGRTLQFFEWGHTWRTIWTDGRALPTEVDEPRWYGYAVGRWDGDTFVVESNGYDERSWLDQDGHPHSADMHVVERYRRATSDTIEVTTTLTDSMTYSQPWVTKSTLRLNPLAEIGEYFCVPSDEEVFRKLMREPAGGARP